MNIFLKTLIVLVIAGVILSFTFLLTYCGPRGVYDPKDPGNQTNLEDAKNLIVEANKLEAEFLESQKLATPTSEDLVKLEKAISLVEEYLNTVQTYDRQYFEKRKMLVSLLHDVKGKELFESLRQLDAKADEAFTKGKFIEALELYKELNNGWQMANKLYSSSQFYDVKMVAKSEKMLEIVSVAPISNELFDTQRAAEKAIQNKDWKEAETLYTKAISLQDKINREYSTTTYASFQKVRELQVELDSLKTAPLEHEIEEGLAKGEEAEKKGDYNHAAEFFKIAYDKQEELNIKYERSRAFSKEKLEKIKGMMQTALSRQLFDSINEQKKRLDNLLRAGGDSLEIPSVAEDLLLKCERFSKEFPKSMLLDDDLILSLRYLGFLGKNISHINRTVNKDLIPIAPDSKTLMLKKEVTQSLYRIIMQENPSRSQDELKPVETVSYANAQDFCRRLSWILARPVTLPKPSEFREAIGSLKYVDLNAISWHAGNSSLQTQRAATKDPNMRGFYDLLGNVAEYTMPENSFSKPAIMGGSAQTWTDSLSEIPYQEIEPNIRGDRMVGFRIVIRE